MSTLDKQYAALAAQVSQEEGAQAWQDLARLRGLRQQLEAAQSALDKCVQANSAALTGIVDVIDATGAAAQGTQAVTLWDVSGASAVLAGQAPVRLRCGPRSGRQQGHMRGARMGIMRASVDDRALAAGMTSAAG